MPAPSTPAIPWRSAWLWAVTLLLVAPASFGAPATTTTTTTPPAAKAPKATEPAAITLSAATVPATGAKSVQVQVARFGRYALSATSAQGSAVQLIDRMAGPGETSGEAGVANGRVDAFLERGEYRLRVLSDRAGSGEARVEARPFVEVSGERPPMLPDVVETSTTLTDLQQRSWWVRIDADENFAVELAGRSLADVRLWRDGQWLDPAAPVCEDIAPDPARPLRRCALTTRLAAGLWQLVAYGGAAVPWSVPDGDQPLHVRRGLTTLPVAGRLTGVVGPFGAERWLVPGQATTWRLELPSGADARLNVRAFDEADPFRRDGTGAGIQKETMPPVGEVDLPAASEGRVVIVSGAVGQPFTLQHFPQTGRPIPVKGSGTYFLTTLHGEDPADSADVTAVLAEVRKDPTAAPPAPIATSLLPLGPDAGYRRKFNLLGTTSLFFDVSAEAEYHVAASVPGVGWRWEPLLTSRAAGLESPPFREGPGATTLTPGRWMLTLAPKIPGVTEVAVRHDPMEKIEPSAPRANVQLPTVTLDASKTYALTLGAVPGAKVGMVLRALPADLAEALPLTLGPDQSVTVPTLANVAGSVSAGAGLELSVDGGAFAAAVDVAPGGHVVTVRNGGAAVVQGAIALTPADRRRNAPLPALPDTALTAPADLPVLSTAGPRALDLAAEATATFGLRVEKAGLYRTESTGLLATAGAIRTRTNPVLASAAVNGVGRNFLLQRYLREGDYQVTVATQGASAGHLGLRLAPTALRDGGALKAGVPARATVPAGEGIAYRYDAPEGGEYLLRSFGQGRLFRVRVEDADGWPLLSPEVDGDLRLDLPPGSGRIIVLPEPVDTIRITTFDKVPPRVARLGHGPHPLTLDVPASHVWWEPTGREDRAPDVWTFALLAPAEVTIGVTGEAENNEMAGDLRRAGDPEPTARLVPGRPWVGRLEAGDYRLEVTSARRNSGVTYSVRVSPRELVPGLSRVVDAPATIPVSVGAAGLVELSSMGVTDVRARLYDGAGKLVFAADDRPDDWNFRIAERLAPGPYALRVDPVGADTGRTTVTLALAGEADAPELTAGQSRTMTLGGEVLRVPLRVASSGAVEGLLVVSAASAENVSLAVETQEEGAWRTVAQATGPAPRVVTRLGVPDRKWRLRVESMDGRGVPTKLRADVVMPRPVGEGALVSGTPIPADKATGVAAALVNRERPGALELANRIGLSWCPTAGEACVEVPGSLLAAPDAAVWLVAPDASGRPLSVRGSRYVLGGAPARVTVSGRGEASVDVAPATGPVLVRATAAGGQPGLRLGAADGAGLAWGTGIAEGAALAVMVDGKASVARVLAASPGAEGPLEIDLLRIALPAPVAGTLPGGLGGGMLAAGSAWTAPLPHAESLGRLVLAEGLVAVLTQGDAPPVTLWAGDGPLDETVETSFDTLTVLNPTAAAAPWSASFTPRVGAADILGPGNAVERVALSGGVTRIPVKASPGATLHVRGAATEAVWIDTNGNIARGRDLRPGVRAGRIEVRHGPGAWVAWVDGFDGADDEARVLWGGPPPSPATSATPIPARMALAGEVESVRVDATDAGLVRVSAGQPVVALVRQDGGKARALLAFDGLVEVPVGAAASVEIALRALGGGALRGVAEVDFAAAMPLAEGLGPEVLLGAGRSLVFSFTIDRKGPIGVGVRADGADVAVTLRGPDGAIVAAGVAMMPELSPGAYLLTATLPGNAAPARIRPALVGIVPPDTGPPEEVIRTYLVAAGLIPPPVTGVGVDAEEIE